ncbi:aldehyde dehydrogenase [Fusibacter bizertensis]
MKKLLDRQKELFRSGKTRPIPFRIEQLNKLKQAVIAYDQALVVALKKDLNKPEFEAYTTEIGYVLQSIEHTIKHLEKWAKERSVKVPFYMIPSTSRILYEPYGTVLIIAPFNYPFQLLIEPLIGAIAAGNTAVLKPSEYTKNVESVIVQMFAETFEEDYIAVVTGGRDVTTDLIHLKFDYIFFTGSQNVGKVVMKAAAENLVPVTLELGGKSPVIVHEDANIKVAASRIVWGKYVNAGQVCVAPDYVYVHKSVEAKFIAEVLKTIIAYYGSLPQNSPDYCRIISERQLTRLIGLIDQEKVIHGGQYNLEQLYLAPTVMTNVTWDDAIMADEIFGPIMPIMTYESIEEVVDEITSKEKPLALYVFSESELVQNYLVDQISFGGGCINDTILHVASPHLPFGGIGNSGMGSYHGEESFKTFSHQKSILKHNTKINHGMMFPPYHNKINLIRKIFK